MFKRLILGAAVIGGVAYFVKKKLGGGYDEDDIDSAGWGDFGDRPPASPEEKGSIAHTRTDVTPEALSTAARIETSLPAILKAWPSITEDEVKSAEADRDKLASLIAEKTGGSKDEIRTKLDGIIAEETPDPSFPAH